MRGPTDDFTRIEDVFVAYAVCLARNTPDEQFAQDLHEQRLFRTLDWWEEIGKEPIL